LQRERSRLLSFLAVLHKGDSQKGGEYMSKNFEHWRTLIDKKYNGAFELIDDGDIRDDYERNLTIKCKRCGAVKVITSITARHLEKRGRCDNALYLSANGANA
jgi:hypothetical protein